MKQNTSPLTRTFTRGAAATALALAASFASLTAIANDNNTAKAAAHEAVADDPYSRDIYTGARNASRSRITFKGQDNVPVMGVSLLMGDLDLIQYAKLHKIELTDENRLEVFEQMGEKLTANLSKFFANPESGIAIPIHVSHSPSRVTGRGSSMTLYLDGRPYIRGSLDTILDGHSAIQDTYRRTWERLSSSTRPADTSGLASLDR